MSKIVLANEEQERPVEGAEMVGQTRLARSAPQHSNQRELDPKVRSVNNAFETKLEIGEWYEETGLLLRGAAIVAFGLFVIRWLLAILPAFLHSLLLAVYIGYHFSKLPYTSKRFFPRPSISRFGASSFTMHTHNILVATWNQGDRAAPSDLNSWLPVNKGIEYTLIAIGVQECCYTVSSGSEYNSSSQADRCHEHWLQSLVDFLGDRYVCIADISTRDSIRMAVFALKSGLPRIHNIQRGRFIVSLPIFYRKGAVAVSLELDHTRILFVNCHLSAHQKHVKQRNADVENIIANLLFGKYQVDLLALSHYVFWLGDLNYRINMTRDSVLEFASARNWKALYETDQLRNEQRAGKLLYLLQELPPSFPPTYKYNRGSRTYDSKGNRIPAWCDRILSTTLYQEGSLQQISLNSSDDVKTSDHAPVTAHFSISTVEFTPAIESTECIAFRIAFQEIALDNFTPLTQHVILRFTAYGCSESRQTTKPTSSIGNGIISWSEKQLPTLQMAPFKWDCLLQQYIHIGVYDYFSSRGDGRYLIGQATLSLRILSQSARAEFSLDLTLLGKKASCGPIRGSLIVAR